MSIREEVVAEARSWVGTPYQHAQCLKGVAVDCAMILREVYCGLNVAPWFEPRPYDAQWFLHRDEERYLAWLAKYAKQIDEKYALPGDIKMYKFGRCVAHGAILIPDGLMIHAYMPAGKVEIIEQRAALVHGTPHSFWSPFK
jgi:NlpC/P60 family putative phage cell wall peptidase